jgi:hypothetical protein
MQTMSAADKRHRISEIQRARFEAEVRAMIDRNGTDG